MPNTPAQAHAYIALVLARDALGELYDELQQCHVCPPRSEEHVCSLCCAQEEVPSFEHMVGLFARQKPTRIGAADRDC